MLDIDYIKRKNINNIIGKKIDYFNKITSTHKKAKEIAFDEENNGKILIAEIQAEGIGTKGRSWHTGQRKKYSNDNYFTTKM